MGGTGWWLEGELGGHCGAEVAGVTAAHILPSHLLGLSGGALHDVKLGTVQIFFMEINHFQSI